MATKQITAVDQALVCAKCGQRATYVEECHDTAFAVGEIIVIRCPNFECKEKPWIFCHSCKKKCYRTSLSQHAQRKKHIEQHAIAYPPMAPPPPDPPATIATATIPEFPGTEMDIVIEDVINGVIGMETDEFHARMEQDLLATHVEGATCSMEVSTPPRPSTTTISKFPKIPTEGNEWLIKAFQNSPRATKQDLFRSFAPGELTHMMSFWAAEHGSGDGRCGGGVMCLVAKAFQQAKDLQLDGNRIPDFEEAFWHFQCLIQHHSMNEKQRARQSTINKTLMDNLPLEQAFFKETFIPRHQQINKFYGVTGQHSMWNNLPCPKAMDVDGVAFVPPRAIVGFLMANGIPIDDILVSKDDDILPFDRQKKVQHVSESRKAVKWINDLRKSYYGTKNGAPNSKNSAPKFPAVICLTLSDWADGFGPGKVKNNRNSVDCKSFTISGPKHLVNATNNTFPVAMGLKKATGWAKVERLFREQVEELTSSPEPIEFYHGGLQKTVPCFFKRFVVMSDRQERNGLSGTMGCGSDMHRHFSVSGKISTPICDVSGIEKLLNAQSKGVKCTFGWSDKCVPRNGSSRNGAILAACIPCRRMGLQQLGMLSSNEQQRATTTPCPKCTNWDLMPVTGGATLDFPAHNDYPESIQDGSPVPPPKGRDVFGEGTMIPFVQLDWTLMKQACKFAFYQASRPGKGLAWTKATTTCYLRFCGVATNHASALYDSAKNCKKAKQMDNVDYTVATGIHDFVFPAAWISTDIALGDHVEAVMHQLFLGIAESNFDLIAIWLKNSPKHTNLALSSFKNCLQTLIRDLRPFQLSWLAAYPLTGKKGDLGTGSWVAENWIFYVRVSQFLHVWCSCAENAAKYGVDDMSRVVNSFVAMVARCLTHNGVNDACINETGLYLKEFMSAIREFDLRVRYKVHNKKAKSNDRKEAEAWWLKPNYMSLQRLLSMMLALGPLTLWWDGGGKGERFIQVVKPFIKRGIREDVMSFFVNLIDKIYQVMQLEQLEKLYGLNGDNSSNTNENQDVLGELVDMIFDAVGDKQQTTSEASSDEDDSDDEDNWSVDSDVIGVEEDHMSRNKTQLNCNEEPPECDMKRNDDDFIFSENERLGMTKTRTIHVYRNEKQLDEAINAGKPIAGIVVVKKDGTGKPFFEFQTVHRKPVKQFAVRRVAFDDTKGVHYRGLWCASMMVNESVQSTSNFADIQSEAKLAAVAIPLWYVIGKAKPDSNKYCVITNWWKNRMSDGWYRLPTLDAGLYKEPASRKRASKDLNPCTSDPVEVRVREENGRQVGEL